MHYRTRYARTGDDDGGDDEILGRRVPSWFTILLVGVVILFVGIFIYALFTTRVDAGEACSITRNGKQVGIAEPGLHFTTPWPRPVKYHCYNTRIQTIEFVDGEPKDSSSKATYVDYNMATHSIDGQRFSVTAIVQYQVDPSKVGELYASGARNNEAVYELLVKTQVRAIVPQMLNTYNAHTLYTGELGNISDQIQQAVADELAPYGITIKTLLVKRPIFSDAYETAIEQAGLQQAQAEAKKAEQEVAKQEAERQRIEAQGNAQAQQIRAQGDADASVIAQNATNQNTISAGQAQAQATQSIADIYGGPAGLLDHERIGAVASANVIYLPSDAVLPVLNLNETGATETSP